MSTYRPLFSDRFHRRPQPAAVAVSQSLAFLFPLLLGVYWLIYAVNVDLATRLIRPGSIALALLLALIWSKPAVTWGELRLGTILAVMCAVLLAPSLAATEPSRALEDWVKLAILCLIGLFLCRALRDAATALAFGRSLILGGFLCGALIVYVYISHMGFQMPTYESARVLKAVAMHGNVPLNSVGFACVFSYTCGMCLIPRNRLLWVLGAVLFVLSSALTGSRAPVAILVASALALLVLNGLVSRNIFKRMAGWLAVLTLAAGIAVGTQAISFKQMSDATEGRWDFWWVAWNKFTERPLMGYGFESWSDDLISRLPGQYRLTAYEEIHLAGGYHNEYITLLAEQGLIGFIPVIALFAFLMRCSWLLAFRSSWTWRNGQWALFGCIFLVLRAAVEAPGLFGYGQEPADYLAYVFAAIVVSRFSVEEDYLKSGVIARSVDAQEYVSDPAAAFA